MSTMKTFPKHSCLKIFGFQQRPASLGPKAFVVVASGTIAAAESSPSGRQGPMDCQEPRKVSRTLSQASQQGNVVH
ncbi:hypothetical protein LZ30DRAFT_784954 [Colletotrichum cereale]|nr:hypothetical protein LZ30DRAFT_784954 [Colletotrichum cereale]